MHVKKTAILFTVILFLGLFCLQGQAKAGNGKKVDDIYRAANDYFKEGLFDKAEKEYLKAIKKYPMYAPAYNSMGIILSMNPAKTKESVIYFLKAINIDPSYPDPYSNLGIICYRIRDPNRAVSYFKKAAGLDPENYENYFNIGWTYLVALKSPEEAIEYLKKAIGLNSDYPEAHYALGMAYINMKEKGFVLEEITKLRMLNREDLASILENIIRPDFIEEETGTKEAAGAKINLPVNTEYKINPEDNTTTQAGTGKMSGSATISIRLQGASPKDEEESK